MQATYTIQTDYKNAVYTPRGGAQEFLYSHDPEVILSGPSETGKTLAACWKAHLICCKYPKAQGAILRKQAVDVAGTVYLTMKRVLADAPVTVYGGDNKPQKLIYANGSAIWIGGLDKPGKILSGERDFVYVCQAEELNTNDLEMISTRITGRGAIIPYPQLFMDCNPSSSKHPILQRVKAGSLRMIKSIHRDNPTLYDESGNLTTQGIRTMTRLEALTGIRRKRLYEGVWATAEGAVFDMFDASIHVVHKDRANYKNFRLAMDEGYTHPAVILAIGEDNDGRRHIFQEFYERGRLQSEVVAQALQMGQEYNTKTATVDAAAAGLIADLRNAGMVVRGGKGRVLDGIHAIQDDLKIQGDGLPRLTIEPSCINTQNDFESLEWLLEKDAPKKENDHATDAVRYDYDTAKHTGWVRGPAG